MPLSTHSCITWKVLLLVLSAVCLLTMRSLLSGTALTKMQVSITSLKTHGELTGVNQDMSELELLTEKESVVFNSSRGLLKLTEPYISNISKAGLTNV